MIAGDTLYLYPYPDSSVDVTINYWRLPAEMTVDSDEPEIPEDWHFLLEYWTLYRCYMRENDITQAQAWKSEWDMELEKLKGELHYDTADPPTQVGGNDFADLSAWW